MSDFFKKSIFLGGLTAIIAAVFVGGVYLGYNQRPEVNKITELFNKETPSQQSQVDFEPFWKTWNLIDSYYVSKGDVDKQKFVWGAIQGLVASLDDPYSVFLPPQEAEMFQSSVRGDFEGVGMEIGIKDKILTVISALKNTPAERAGIKSGDKILKIGDTVTSDMTVDKAVSLIRGPKGTKILLAILREAVNKPLEIEVTRDKIEIPVLSAEQKENGVFVISLYNFSSRSADEFRQALRQMVESNSNKLVLDLRGNPGGYLESAVDMASWFLPAGKVVAREHFGDGKEDLYRSKGYNVFSNLKMVILMNGGTASAAEILAGALQEHGVAKLIGEKSFGKGSVQQLFDVTDKSSLKLTIAKWLTPNGKSISKEGLVPDVEVKLVETDKTDVQMEKAVGLLKGK
ncbi:MAG: S41 family peptidase [bacterium]|nr:S41 family peptidase [bacterium]